MSLAAIMRVLFFAMAPSYVSADAHAMEQAATGDGLDLMAIRENQTLSGRFDSWPLLEVLVVISRESGFQYHGDKDVLTHPVSGLFKQLSSVDAVQRMLESFNYVMILGATGEILRLEIISVADRDAAGSRETPLSTSLSDDLAKAAIELELEELGDFGPFMGTIDPNDPVLQNLSEFELAESGSDPNDPDVGLQSLPEFEPVAGETDPNDPNVGPQSLPEFMPVVSESDPNDPDAGFQGLPEIDSIANDGDGSSFSESAD